MPVTTCKLLTATELANGIAAGYYILRNGPHDTEGECITSCVSTGTGTGTDIETGTGTVTSDIYYWYCMAAPPDTGTGTEIPNETGTGTDSGGIFQCLLLTPANVILLTSVGWTFGGGPYNTLVECSTFCHGLTGTGTLEEIEWYCMNEITTVTPVGGCSPCATQPAAWSFTHGGTFFPSPQIVGPSSVCNTWTRTVDPLIPATSLPCGMDHAFSWQLAYNVLATRFELRLTGISSSPNSYSYIYMIWTCPVEEWNCFGPNTLIGGGFSSTVHCFGGGFDGAITIYPV